MKRFKTAFCPFFRNIAWLVPVLVLMMAFAFLPVSAQINTTGAQQYAKPNSFISFSPAQLGASAITLPPSSQTALTNISYTPYTTGTTLGQLLIGSEHAPLSDTGSGNASNIVLPQRAIAMKWANGTSTAGTCTARAFLAY